MEKTKTIGRVMATALHAIIRYKTLVLVQREWDRPPRSLEALTK
jgi:hypothetical protein